MVGEAVVVAKSPGPTGRPGCAGAWQKLGRDRVMLRWLLYLGVLVACLQFAYIAQLAARHREVSVFDDRVATSEAFSSRPKRAIEYQYTFPEAEAKRRRRARSSRRPNLKLRFDLNLPRGRRGRRCLKIETLFGCQLF